MVKHPTKPVYRSNDPSREIRHSQPASVVGFNYLGTFFGITLRVLTNQEVGKKLSDHPV